MNTSESSSSYCASDESPRSKRVRFSETVYFCEQQLIKSLEEMERQQQHSPQCREKEARPTFVCSSDCGTSSIQGQDGYYTSSLSLLGYRVKPRTVPL